MFDEGMCDTGGETGSQNRAILPRPVFASNLQCDLGQVSSIPRCYFPVSLLLGGGIALENYYVWLAETRTPGQAENPNFPCPL